MSDRLVEGKTVSVVSESGSTYELQRRGQIYSCTCQAWKNQGKPTSKRTCKHLRKLLGDDVETKRCGPDVKRKKNNKEKDEKSKKRARTEVKVLLANVYDESTHVCAGMWMSEKLDGVRAVWQNGKMLSRNGIEFGAPASFTANFPSNVTFDGELFWKRKSFNDTISMVRGDDWKLLQYRVFDIPSEGKRPFEERLQVLEQWAKKINSTHFIVVPQTECKSTEGMRAFFDEVVKGGGEGVMLRAPKSMYEPKRSNTLLKVKPKQDAEATVIGYKMGKGKNKNTVGSLQCKFTDGKTFYVGTGLSDQDRKNPPKINSRITFSYQELTQKGIPRHPAFKAIFPQDF